MPGLESEKLFRPRVEPVTDYGRCNIVPAYEVEKAVVGNSSLDLKISIECVGPAQLKLEDCISPDQSLITLRKLSSNPEPSEDEATGWRKTEYLYRGAITDKAEPQVYQIEMKLKYPDPNREFVTRYFPLNVGVRQGGRLKVIDVTPRNCVMGRKTTFALTLLNDFHDYVISIHKVTAKSIPDDLMLRQEIPCNLSIEPNQQGDLKVDLNITGITLSRLLAGLSTSQKLDFTLVYDDNYGRPVSNLGSSWDIKAKLHPLVWLVSMIIGVLVGTLIKFVGQADKRFTWANIRWIGGTIGLGIVISVIALLGDVEVVGFKYRGSNDNPIMVFLIGLAGAVGGIRIIELVLERLHPAGAAHSGNNPSLTAPHGRGRT